MTAPLYNEERKLQFLGEYDDLGTQNTYYRVLAKSSILEKDLDKDLCEFTLLEIEEVLYDLNPMTTAVSQTNGRIISAYLNWAVEKGIRSNPLHPLVTVEASFFKKFVDPNRKIYFSHEEIIDYVTYCENAQDGVIVSLLFDGINGKECSEIRNIKRNDYNIDDQTLTVTNELGKKRTVKVSKETIRLLDQASKEETYVNKNGYMSATEYGEKSYLVSSKDSDYVIRSSNKSSEVNYGAVNMPVIFRRLKSISKTLGVPYFTSKNIFRSGIIYYGAQLLKERGKLEKEEYDMIAERFCIKNPYSLKDYCNERYINELYPKMLVK